LNPAAAIGEMKKMMIGYESKGIPRQGFEWASHVSAWVCDT
jgi:hypothetical protein